MAHYQPLLFIASEVVFLENPYRLFESVNLFFGRIEPHFEKLPIARRIADRICATKAVFQLVLNERDPPVLLFQSDRDRVQLLLKRCDIVPADRGPFEPGDGLDQPDDADQQGTGADRRDVLFKARLLSVFWHRSDPPRS